MRRLYILGLVAIVFLLILLTGPSVTGFIINPIEDNENGLVALWHMNEGIGSIINDSSGNGNNGMINGAIWANGTFGNALNFNGRGDRVEVSDSASLKLNDNLSIEAWIKTSSTARQVIIGKYKRNTHPGYSLSLASDTVIEFTLDDNKKGSSTAKVTLTNSIKDSWHQIVGVRNKTESKLYIYFDGQLAGEGIDNAGNIISDIPLYIGIYGNVKSNNFVGAIDEIAIYNRALTAEEILEHYNKIQPLCEESWSCTEWAECTLGCTQNRTCTDENQCGTELEKPNETQDCIYCVESWTCTEWTECIDGTQTRGCTDQNICGTFDFKPGESQICEVLEEFISDKEILPGVLISAKGASFGGAAGISGEVLRGGSLETEVKSAQMLEAVSYDYSIPIYKIELLPLVELTNSKIIIEDLGTIIPNDTKPPGRIVYRFFDITTKNIPNASNIKIYFKVEKPFYVDNDISVRSTRLLRWNSIDWQELETKLIVSDLNYYYFISNTNELSYFAISTLGVGELTAETPILWIISITAVIMVIIVIIRRSRYYRK